MSGLDAVTILVVDDEEAVLNGVRRTLRAAGFENVLMCRDPRDVEPLLDADRVSLILLDLMMPHLTGHELLERIVASHPEIPVIVVTAEQDIRTAVECMKNGAYDYLVKPSAGPELVAVIERALAHRELREENARLRAKLLQEALAHPEQFDEIITVDAAMHALFAYLEVIAPGSNPVLISGETGSGKELFARAIHNLSGRRGPFCAVNVAGLDDTMFSDTLFGHKPGAFTGAVGTRKGMIESAGRGTLFLDEIGDLSEASQVKLLRVLQEREYHTLGDDVPKRLEARVVAATHQDPAKLRRDLYFRLRGYHVRIPPLRERTGDLPSLVNHFVREAAHTTSTASRPSFPSVCTACCRATTSPATCASCGPWSSMPSRATPGGRSRSSPSSNPSAARTSRPRSPSPSRATARSSPSPNGASSSAATSSTPSSARTGRSPAKAAPPSSSA